MLPAAVEGGKRPGLKKALDEVMREDEVVLLDFSSTESLNLDLSALFLLTFYVIHAKRVRCCSPLSHQYELQHMPQQQHEILNHQRQQFSRKG